MEPRPLSSEERSGYSRTPSIVSVTLISKGCFTSFVAWSFLLSPARPVARVVWGRTEPSWRSCHRGERLVDLNFEYAERLGTPQHLDLLRVPPRLVRKLGIRALKLMMGKRMCLRKC